MRQYDDDTRPPIDPDAGDVADPASEHDDMTVAEGDRGGPEGVPETESPDGYGGPDEAA